MISKFDKPAVEFEKCIEPFKSNRNILTTSKGKSDLEIGLIDIATIKCEENDLLKALKVLLQVTLNYKKEMVVCLFTSKRFDGNQVPIYIRHLMREFIHQIRLIEKYDPIWIEDSVVNIHGDRKSKSSFRFAIINDINENEWYKQENEWYKQHADLMIYYSIDRKCMYGAVDYKTMEKYVDKYYHPTPRTNPYSYCSTFLSIIFPGFILCISFILCDLVSFYRK